MAAFSGDDSRRGDERSAGHLHLHRNLLHVGRQLLLERRCALGIHLQRSGPQARIPRRRQDRFDRRRGGGQREQDRQCADYHRRRTPRGGGTRGPAGRADTAAGRADRNAPEQRLRRPAGAPHAVPDRQRGVRNGVGAQARRRDRGDKRCAGGWNTPLTGNT